MECGMSLADLAAVKVAVELCNNPELKREILMTRDRVKRDNAPFRILFEKRDWDEIIETKATMILRNLGLTKDLLEKIMGLVFLIGMRMLTWAEYHEDILEFSREFTTNFLNSSFFKQLGIIDSKKAAEELLYDENLNNVQKYKLACLYCLTDNIYFLYDQVTEVDIQRFCKSRDYDWSKRACLIKFWSHYLMGEMDKITWTPLDQYWLKEAIKNGSTPAVAYCFEKTNLRDERNALVDAAVETVRNLLSPWYLNINPHFKFSKDGLKSWVPSDYYVDILCFLLSKMREDQQIEFLKIDIESERYELEVEDRGRSRVLKFLLDWPYQGYFMKMVRLMWEFLPETDYADLLLQICDRIEGEVGTSKYGEGKSYNYRGLLKEFWYQSPEHYKKYVLRIQKNVYENDGTFERDVGLLVKILALKNFTSEDIKNIELILRSATVEEKQNITSSEKWKNDCIKLIELEKWKILDEFVLSCFPYKEGADKFKRKLIFTESSQCACIDFVRKEKWDAAESFIKWCSLPEEDIKQLKREMINSEKGFDTCKLLIFDDENVKSADKFIRWCIFPEEEVKTFKKDLMFSEEFIFKCWILIYEKEKLDIVNTAVNFCLSSDEDIREFKKIIADEHGCDILTSIIFGYSCESSIVYEGKRTGRMWTRVEIFLTWCFSSEAEMSEFKKGKLLEESGMKIHFKLIENNQWEKAETFFAWLGLSDEEIKDLKKKTLFNPYRGSRMFVELMYSEEGNETFCDYGSKQEAIELLLRWYLTDKEMVLEFKDEFKRKYGGEETEKCRAMLENFDLAIEQRLRDLDEEQRSVKGKSETSVSSKRRCNS